VKAELIGKPILYPINADDAPDGDGDLAPDSSITEEDL